MVEPTSSRKVEHLTPYDVLEMMEEKEDEIVIVDVREPWEYYGDTGHVKNSLHIPMAEIPERIEELKKLANRHIAIICNSGSRSYSVCQYLRDLGFERIYNVQGGIMQWHLSGLDVEYKE